MIYSQRSQQIFDPAKDEERFRARANDDCPKSDTFLGINWATSCHLFGMGQELSRFEELFLHHLDAAYNLARWIVKSDQEAQDVVQEAYARALENFSGFRGVNPRAWLLTIVRNTAYSWIQKHLREDNIIPFDEKIHAIPPNEPRSEASYEKRRQQLQEALSRLPPDFREVLVLYEFEGWSYKKMASTLNVPVGTVMSRLSRARRRLHEAISELQNMEVEDEL